MINSLYIKNVALIEETELEFSPGLNIITGETGSGKSMIADSLNFILGRRAPKDFVRGGESFAEVTCVIEIADENRERLTELDAEPDEDNLLIIKRNMAADTGKSVCKINGKTVSVGTVKDISEILFDIHSQHEHQGLLKTARHLEILDRFCEGADEIKARLAEIVKQLSALDKQIAEIGVNDEDRASRLDLYSYQINEIKTAALKDGEEEELFSRRKILNNSEEIAEKTNAAIELLSGSDTSATDSLGEAANYIARLTYLDSSCEVFAQAAESITAQLDELVRDMQTYQSTIEHDPYEVMRIDERLNLIYNLKRKYGKNIREILDFLQKTEQKYEMLESSEERLAGLNKARVGLRESAEELCAAVSEKRIKAASEISQKIADNLRELEMKDAKFEAVITRREDFNATGYDRAEFMISPNAGEELKPLANIASGGEVSRVMLALKTVLADADTAETFVFDEIDTGVSGRTAQKVAEKLKIFSQKRQILCITHLPQIAAMADRHFLVEKKSDGEKTTTSAASLNEEKIIAELARLIGGAVITEATLKAASELRERQ